MKRLGLKGLLVFIPLVTSGLNAGDSFAETRKKAEAGDFSAQVKLSKMYENGDGIPKDHAEAVKWIRRSIKTMNADIANGRGWLYEVPENPEEAVRWYRKWAERGDGVAQLKLGIQFYEGKGIAKDVGEAVKWWRLAAEQGNADAQFNLGLMHCEGIVVLKDFVEAHAWWNLAGAGGVEDAREKISAIEKKMTREQIAEATKLARERLKKYEETSK